MINNRSTLIISMVEEFFGRLAVAYHRTTKEGMATLAEKGKRFNIGHGDTYGAGAYLTYDLQSQIRKKMIDLYGEYLIKFKVKIDNFVILNRNISEKVYGRNNVLLSQQIRNIFKIPDKYWMDTSVEETIRDIDYSIMHSSNASSHTASIFYNILMKDKIFSRNTKGLIFSGNTDGNVIVSYRPYESLVPMAYTHSPDISSPLNWKPANNIMSIYRSIKHSRISDNSIDFEYQRVNKFLYLLKNMLGNSDIDGRVVLRNNQIFFSSLFEPYPRNIIETAIRKVWGNIQHVRDITTPGGLVMAFEFRSQVTFPKDFNIGFENGKIDGHSQGNRKGYGKYD